ncbi:MAG: hypothetical protein WD872_17955 [Pirellulaceae bacterium]
MKVVRHQGVSVAVDHPAVWFEKGEQIVRDLIEILTHHDVSRDSLRHLIASRRRLARGRYRAADGRGCLMSILTERLPAHKQIHGKADLVRFFGRGASPLAAEHSAEYQPAKWLVRLVDGQFCRELRRRYGRACELFDYEVVLEVARQVLALRDAVETTLRPRSLVVANAASGAARGQETRGQETRGQETRGQETAPARRTSRE